MQPSESYCTLRCSQRAVSQEFTARRKAVSVNGDSDRINRAIAKQVIWRMAKAARDCVDNIRNEARDSLYLIYLTQNESASSPEKDRSQSSHILVAAQWSASSRRARRPLSRGPTTNPICHLWYRRMRRMRRMTCETYDVFDFVLCVDCRSGTGRLRCGDRARVLIQSLLTRAIGGLGVSREARARFRVCRLA